MTYQSDTIVSLNLPLKRDEITIYQEVAKGSSFVIFRGFLKAGGETTSCSITIVD